MILQNKSILQIIPTPSALAKKTVMCVCKHIAKGKQIRVLKLAVATILSVDSYDIYFKLSRALKTLSNSLIAFTHCQQL